MEHLEVSSFESKRQRNYLQQDAPYRKTVKKNFKELLSLENIILDHERVFLNCKEIIFITV